MSKRKTTYEVTGPTAYRGHAPGETFTASLDPDAERRALARGSIRVVPPKPSEREAKTDE